MSLRNKHVGDALETYVVESVDPERMKLMSALMRDPNPIHFDPAAVSALGLGERTVNQGPATLSYLVNMLVDASGGPEHLRRVHVRLHGNVFAGDRVECRGRVTGINDDKGTASIEIEACVGDTAVIAGSAVVATR
jgi:acyl dehydratase